MSDCKERLKQLEQLIVTGVQNNPGQIFSIETLLDGLIILYDECCSSTLRREKSITNFVDFGKSPFILPVFCMLSERMNNKDDILGSKIIVQ